MKAAVIAGVVVLAFAVGLWLGVVRLPFGSRRQPAAPEPRTLEEKLALLRECGLALAEPFGPADLLASFPRAEFEKPGFDLVLVGLGMEEEKEPFRPHCANLWHFDTECIEDDGDYARIARRMSAMAQGSLPFADIRDEVDVQAGTARLSFTFAGEPVAIDCAVEDDWVDSKLFGRFVAMLARSDPAKVFVHYDLGGQDCLIGCVRRSELDELRRRGVAFVPLT